MLLFVSSLIVWRAKKEATKGEPKIPDKLSRWGAMASFRKRSDYWTATIGKKGFNQFYRTFNTKTESET